MRMGDFQPLIWETTHFATFDQATEFTRRFAPGLTMQSDINSENDMNAP